MGNLRQWLAAILVFGLVGSGIELLLLKHYEDEWQFVPLVLIAAALIALAWNARTRSRASRLLLRLTMVMFVLAGPVGVGFHYHGAEEFQLEIDPSQHGWPLWKKVLRAQAPPVLAPGLMMQFGFLGLVYTSERLDRREVSR
jgi:multisubunit Na+/H+ antiporter MnhB subunit